MKKLLAIILLVSVCSPASGMEEPVEGTAQAAQKPPQKIRLESSDEQTFTIDKELISKSITIKNMLEDLPTVAIPLPNIAGKTLQAIIKCLEQPASTADVMAELSGDQLIAFIQAITYLDIQELVEKLPVIRWLLSQHSTVHQLEEHGKESGGINTAALSTNGAIALTGAWDGTTHICDTHAGECLHILKGNPRISVALSADGSIALTGSWDGTAHVWDTHTGKCLNSLIGHESPSTINEVALCADGSIALTGSSDKTARIWDTGTGKCLRILRDHGSEAEVDRHSTIGSVEHVALGADGSIALTSSNDNIARIWDAGTGKCLCRLSPEDSIFAVALSPNGNIALTQSTSSRIWDTHTGTCLYTLKSTVRPAFNADGSIALIGSTENAACILDIRTGRYLQTLTGHTGPVHSAALSADGSIALTGSDDKTVRVWDTRAGKCLRTFSGYTHKVRAVELSADFSIALTQSFGETVILQLPSCIIQLQNLGLNQLILLSKIHEKRAARRSNFWKFVPRMFRFNLTAEESAIFRSLPDNIQAFFADYVLLAQ
jgi:WD40 repeat protein